MVRHHADRGDAQTCAVMARTLLPVLPRLASRARSYRWTMAYVELLQRLQRFELANGVIKASEDERVQKLSQRSTTIHVGGGGGSSSLGVPPRAMCSVCQLPVRGLYAWCQGCGHGGHAQHMRECCSPRKPRLLPMAPVYPQLSHSRHFVRSHPRLLIHLTAQQVLRGPSLMLSHPHSPGSGVTVS